MRPYWAIFIARSRLLLRYRAAAAAGFGTQVFWGILRMMIFAAFMASVSGPQPMTGTELTGYIWLAQALLVILPWNIEPEIGASVRTGAVAYELVRPLGLFSHWFARHVALRCAPGFWRCVPMMLMTWALGWLPLPPSPAAGIVFVLSVIAAILLGAAISTLMAVSLFWTVAGEGLLLLMAGVVMLASGLAVPIPLFPERFQALLAWLPFRGLMDTPYRLYLGHAPISNAPAMLAHQLLWTFAIAVLGWWLTGRGLKRLAVHGG